MNVDNLSSSSTIKFPNPSTESIPWYILLSCLYLNISGIIHLATTFTSLFAPSILSIVWSFDVVSKFPLLPVIKLLSNSVPPKLIILSFPAPLTASRSFPPVEAIVPVFPYSAWPTILPASPEAPNLLISILKVSIPPAPIVIFSASVTV